VWGLFDMVIGPQLLFPQEVRRWHTSALPSSSQQSCSPMR
jgi:hypothetical protein